MFQLRTISNSTCNTKNICFKGSFILKRWKQNTIKEKEKNAVSNLYFIEMKENNYLETGDMHGLRLAVILPFLRRIYFLDISAKLKL